MTLSVCDTIAECSVDSALICSIYECLPEDGARLLFLSRDGQVRPEDPDQTSPSQPPNLEYWQDIVKRLDDGDDPVVTGSGDASLVITELPRALGSWSHVCVVLPQRSVDHVLQNFDLIQMCLGQIRLACRGI